MKFRKWTGTLLVFVIVSAMVLQGYYSAGGIAGAGRIAVANPLSFPVTGSWYREKLEVAMHLANQIPRGETVLTFSFGAYYYLATEGIYYVDLIDGALSSYPLRGLSFTSTLRQLLQSENLAEIKNALTSIDATFILVPTAYNSTVPFEYSLFEKFNQNSDLLRILSEAGLLSLLWEYGHYQLYALTTNMRPQQIGMPQPVDNSRRLCLCTTLQGRCSKSHVAWLVVIEQLKAAYSRASPIRPACRGRLCCVSEARSASPDLLARFDRGLPVAHN
jgi:hypothetical protein